MSYLDNLKTEANYTKTLNGAKTHGSTGDACLDLFSVAGGMRCRREADQIRLFDRAYIENPEIAMKLLFHIRDIRGGIGEREIFRTLIRHVAKTWPKSAEKNVRWISEFGRWDDLMCIMGTPCQTEVVRIIRQQLEQDLDAISRRKIDNGCLYINLLTEQLYFLHSVKKGMSKRSRYLITNKQDCGIRSPQIVFQMMTDTTGFAHTGCRNDHLRLCIYIDHLRFIARDCHS